MQIELILLISLALYLHVMLLFFFCFQSHLICFFFFNFVNKGDVLPTPFFVELTPLCLVSNVLIDLTTNQNVPKKMIHLSHPGKSFLTN